MIKTIYRSAHVHHLQLIFFWGWRHSLGPSKNQPCIFLQIQPHQVQAMSSEGLPLSTVVKRKFSVGRNVLNCPEEDGMLFTSYIEKAVKWLQVHPLWRMLDSSTQNVNSDMTPTWAVAIHAEFRLASFEEKQTTQVFSWALAQHFSPLCSCGDDSVVITDNFTFGKRLCCHHPCN